MPVEALVVGFYSLLSFYSLALNPIRLSQSDNRINCVESPKPLKANMHVGILYEPNFHLSTAVPFVRHVLLCTTNKALMLNCKFLYFEISQEGLIGCTVTRVAFSCLQI